MTDRMAELNHQIPAVVKTWKTPKGQIRRMVRYRGRIMSLDAMCHEIGVSHYAVSDRLKKGYTIDEAIHVGRLPEQNSRRYELDGREYTVWQLSKLFGIGAGTLYNRLSKMSVREAVKLRVASPNGAEIARLKARIAELEAECLTKKK